MLVATPAPGQDGEWGRGGLSKRSESIVHIDGVNYRVHTVEKGETLYSLAKLYSMTEDELVAANPLVREGVKAGQVIKIPVPEASAPAQTAREAAKIFDEYTVKAGDTSYSIARSYGISLTTLVEDNPAIDPVKLPIGAVLRIRKAEKGETHPWKVTEQWRDYRDAANSIAIGVTDIRLLMIGTPYFFSMSSPVFTRSFARLTILSYILSHDLPISLSAQSRSDMPIVIVLMSRFSS